MAAIRWTQTAKLTLRSWAEVTVKHLAAPPPPRAGDAAGPSAEPRPRALRAPRPPRGRRARSTRCRPRNFSPRRSCRELTREGRRRRGLDAGTRLLPATLCPFTRVSALRVAAKPEVRAARVIALARRLLF